MGIRETTVPQPKGYLLRLFRTRAGLTQEELADAAKVNIKTLRRAEGGQVTEYTLLCLSRALAVPPVNFYDPEEMKAFLGGRLADGDGPGLDELRAGQGSEDETDPDDVLQRYKILPGRYVDRKLEIVFEQKDTWHSIDVEITEALGLRSGETVNSGFTIRTKSGHEASYQLFASGQLADTLLDIPQGTTITALATTVYGTYLDRYERSFRDYLHDEVKGLLLTRIISVANREEPSPGTADSASRGD